MRQADQSVGFLITSAEKAFRLLAELPEGVRQDTPARNLSGLFATVRNNAEHSCGGFAAEQRFLPKPVLQQRRPMMLTKLARLDRCVKRELNQ